MALTKGNSLAQTCWYSRYRRLVRRIGYSQVKRLPILHNFGTLTLVGSLRLFGALARLGFTPACGTHVSTGSILMMVLFRSLSRLHNTLLTGNVARSHSWYTYFRVSLVANETNLLTDSIFCFGAHVDVDSLLAVGTLRHLGSLGSLDQTGYSRAI